MFDEIAARSCEQAVFVSSADTPGMRLRNGEEDSKLRQRTEKVLEELGYDAEMIAGLRESGAV